MNNNIDIAFVTETWWTEKSVKVVKGYDVYYRNRPEKEGKECKGGGVCLFVKKSLMSHEVGHEVLLSQDCEQIWCVVKYGGESVLCGAIYRPPGSKLRAGE